MKNNGVKKDSVKNYSQIQKAGTLMSYNVRADLRFGNSFYSMLANEKGQACILKGTSSHAMDIFKIEHSDTSKIFRLDSVAAFYNAIYKIKAKPKIHHHVNTDTARVEIYFDGIKIYDGPMTGEEFWDVFRPTFGQLPNGYCFYCTNDKPFELE
ncbi:hypothetical protein [Mucilaginibacter aquariorum]|uniref:KTSC domain-containing protein n=1 Tax=Mucilaginibacter aquariorum TaxID=2967225 RepID=A0ABT1T4Y2_9SPHI|nr:hypothetical protein [Mucilaginibacter aquariorum]MCQ6959687.1 hypothetical protein [Mucilaginibacter aquariorum]